MLVRFDYPKTFDNMMEDCCSTDCIPARSTFPAMDIVEQENEIVSAQSSPEQRRKTLRLRSRRMY